MFLIDESIEDFEKAIEKYLAGLKFERSIYDYHVVCDETNQTTMDDDALYVDIFVVHVPHFIKVDFTIINTNEETQ